MKVFQKLCRCCCQKRKKKKRGITSIELRVQGNEPKPGESFLQQYSSESDEEEDGKGEQQQPADAEEAESEWQEEPRKEITMRMSHREIDDLTTDYYRSRAEKSVDQVWEELKTAQEQIEGLQEKVDNLTEGVRGILELQLKAVQADFSFFATEGKYAFLDTKQQKKK